MKSLRMDKASKRLIVLAKNKDPDCIQIRVLIWQITLIWIQMHPVVKGGVHFVMGRGAFEKSVQPNECKLGIIYKRVHTGLLLVKPFYGIYRLIR